MKFYATLNENKICLGSQSSNYDVIGDVVEITESEYTSNIYMWKKFENNVWSTETFEPVSTAPIDEFETLKVNQATAQQAIMGIMNILLPPM